MKEIDRQMIESLLIDGKKIEAIKTYRESTETELKEAKDAVEQIEAQLISDGRLTKKSSGCLGVFLFFTLLSLILSVILLLPG